jgi:hypothetical protein
MVIEASIGKVLIDKEKLFILVAIPQQLYKIRMRKSSQNIHLCLHHM